MCIWCKCLHLRSKDAMNNKCRCYSHSERKSRSIRTKPNQTEWNQTKLNWTALNSTELRVNVSEDNVIFIGSAYRNDIQQLFTITATFKSPSSHCISSEREEKKCQKLQQNWTQKGKPEKRSGSKSLQHWIIHQTDFLPRSVHSGLLYFVFDA